MKQDSPPAWPQEAYRSRRGVICSPVQWRGWVGTPVLSGPCGQTERQTPVKTLPSRRTTHAGSNDMNLLNFLHHRFHSICIFSCSVDKFSFYLNKKPDLLLSFGDPSPVSSLVLVLPGSTPAISASLSPASRAARRASIFRLRACTFMCV